MINASKAQDSQINENNLKLITELNKCKQLRYDIFNKKSNIFENCNEIRRWNNEYQSLLSVK